MVSSESVAAVADTAMAPWQGTLSLTYARRGDRTQITHQQAQAPLKLQRAFYPEGPAVCHTAILHTAGGIVGGDRLAVDVQLQPQTHALITTPAASKLYRSAGIEAQQQLTLNLAAGACVEWLPQEAIAFEQSHFRQDLRVNLAPGAVWLSWELVRFGRTARGESFQAGRWRSHTEVWQDQQPLWIDRQQLHGTPETWGSLNGLAGCPIVGTLALVGVSVPPDWVTEARSRGADLAADFGVTRLPMGLLCRYRGHSLTDARRWLLAVWQLLRPHYCGRSAQVPRLWQL